MAESKITLIVSEDKEPLIKVKPGMRVEQVKIAAVDEKGKEKAALATLCGYETTYCVALVEVT